MYPSMYQDGKSQCRVIVHWATGYLVLLCNAPSYRLQGHLQANSSCLAVHQDKKVFGHFLQSRQYTHVWSQYWYHVAQKWHDDESYNHRQLVNNSYHVDGRTLHTRAWPQFINNPSCNDARCKDIQRIVIFSLIFRKTPDSGSLISSQIFTVVYHWPSLLSVYLYNLKQIHLLILTS